MSLSNSNISCGVKQLYNLGYPPAMLIREVKETDRLGFSIVSRGAFYVFSDVNQSGNGQRLTAFIEKWALGEVTKTKCARNPNSDNWIAVWVWKVDWARLRSFNPDRPTLPSKKPSARKTSRVATRRA